MGLTNFPNGITSFGGVVAPFPGLVPSIPPALGAACYFLDGTNGSDGNDGLTPLTALKSLDIAYGKLTSGYNQIIYVIPGNTAVSLSTAYPSSGAGLNWSKNYCHVIGVGPTLALGQRSRITNGASTNLMTPLLQVSGIGNSFQNVEIAQVGSHATTAAVCVAVTGLRNTFINCQISSGIGALNIGAAMRSLIVGGITAGTATTSGGESYFKHCYIGADTIAQGAASATMEILAGTPRLVFEDCVFAYYTSTGDGFWVKIGADGIDRFCLMKNCTFWNPYTFSGGVILSNGMSLNAAIGGMLLLQGSCPIIGATATAATKTCLFFDNANGSTTTNKSLVAGW